MENYPYTFERGNMVSFQVILQRCKVAQSLEMSLIPFTNSEGFNQHRNAVSLIRIFPVVPDVQRQTV